MHPLHKLAFNPGVNTEATQTLNAGSWSFSNLIRWFNGYLQKMGGWQRLTSSQFTGVSRGLHAYEDLNGNSYLISGSATAFQIYHNGTIYTLSVFGSTHELDVPFMASSTITPHSVGITDASATVNTGDSIYLAVPAYVDGVGLYPGIYTVDSGGTGSYSIAITDTITTNDSNGGTPPGFATVPGGALPSVSTNSVFVAFNNHGLSVGDTFTVNVATSVGGITLFGPYPVINVASANIFYIDAGQSAVTTGSAYELQDSSGNPMGRISYATSIPGTVKSWSIDNFGSALLACYQGGPVLAWNPPIITTSLAAEGISTAPQVNEGLFVAMPQAQVIAFGSSVGTLQDPLLVRFSDAGNYTGWTADADNQAGSFRLSRGSKIVGGRQAPQVSLLWTDLDCWSMQYVGTPFIYSFNIVQMGCGLIAQRAHAVLYGQVYWMSQKQFFTYGANGVSPLSCPVWDVVFGDLDSSNLDIICAGSNAGFNEIMWFYPSSSGGTGEIDSYVKYNVVSQLWDYGTLDRTSWIDQSVLGSPIGMDLNRRAQQHEIGYDADDVAMDGVFIESGFIDLGEGSDMIFIDQIIPDFKWFGNDGSLILRMVAKNYPADPGIKYGPYSINANTRYISLRMRARQVAWRLEWAAARGFSARLGAIRYHGKPAGSRP